MDQGLRLLHPLQMIMIMTELFEMGSFVMTLNGLRWIVKCTVDVHFDLKTLLHRYTEAS